MISIFDVIILGAIEFILIVLLFSYASQKDLKKIHEEHNKKANDLQMRISRLFDENKKINQTYQETAEKLNAIRNNTN